MSTFPQPWNSTVSHWQATNRGPNTLWNHNRDASFDTDTVDTVIVGGGMMGAALSYFLTREAADKGSDAGKTIYCLDAKDCGSGASTFWRNVLKESVGPQTYLEWHGLQQPYPIGIGCTPEAAVRVVQSERDNLDLVEALVKENKLDVDFWRGELFETHYSKEETEWSKKTYEAWLEARAKLGLSGDDTSFVDDKDEAERLSRFKGVTSVLRRPTGSVHSHKLCTALMNAAISAPAGNFKFFSWTPVTARPEKDESGLWVLQTSKGPLKAKQVILCTNAHTQHMFDKTDLIASHIQPFRGQCATITPPTTYSNDKGLRGTYNTHDGHYLVTTKEGQMVLGGGVRKYIKEGSVPLDWYTGAVDDSEAGIHPVLTKDLAQFMPNNFIDWGAEAHGEGLTRTWVGIMASSKDELPLVGGVPGKEGLYVAAGFSGHGMSRIFVTARSLAHTLKTGTWDPALLPKEFELTAERLQRVKDAQLAFEKENPNMVVVDGELMDRTQLGGQKGLWRFLPKL